MKLRNPFRMCSATRKEGKKSAREVRQEKIDNYYHATHPADKPEKAISLADEKKESSVEEGKFADKGTSTSFLDEKKDNELNKLARVSEATEDDIDSAKAEASKSSLRREVDSDHESEKEEQEVVYDGAAGLEKSPSMTEPMPLCGACGCL
ncbi:hypothetical protein MPSEU_000394300 [Mayamaea pseudoterrestris]|nr:hypothetical protein MPSEU_000394300 [Mayamaea pseudoterrestris]